MPPTIWLKPRNPTFELLALDAEKGLTIEIPYQD